MDSPQKHYALAIEALEELTAELVTVQPRSKPSAPIPIRPALEQVLDDLSPLPREALFLGAAYDGLPVLLNLRDPAPGPILVAGDAGSGKTALLQMVAQAATFMHDSKSVQFGVVTNYPDEWQSFGGLPNCAGVFPTYHNAAMDFILSLTDWAHNNRGGKQSVLLLLDDLESMTHIDPEDQQNLRWLLLRGPNRHVWPIVTLNAGRTGEVLPWLDAFRTRLFGQIRNAAEAEALVPARGANLNALEPGLEFKLREGKRWLRFWIPSFKS
ncbi:MAG: hypothetical protein GXP40_13595 [Chloroflexi bacterium]|nr:hypothetical protein [Chloroflexota bacterium]